MMYQCLRFFFFSSRRRHTRFKCDWSSDVCSSDLPIFDFRNRVHLPEYRCRVLYGDPLGRLWLGFEDGEVAVHENEEFHVYSSKDGLPGGKVLAITRDRAGNFWIGSEGGLSRFDHGHLVTLPHKNGLPGNSVPGLVEVDEGF